MDFLGDRTAEFRRGRGPDKKPRRRGLNHMQKTALGIGGTLTAIGVGTTAIVNNSRSQIADMRDESRLMRREVKGLTSRNPVPQPQPLPRADGYKRLSKTAKRAKLLRRQAAVGAKRGMPSVAKAAAVLARMKMGLKYNDSSPLTLFDRGESMDTHWGQSAEFKRGRGPDKKPRKRRGTQVGIAGASIASGAGAGYGLSSLGREIGDRRTVNRVVNNLRTGDGKRPSRMKLNIVRRKIRDEYRQNREIGRRWKGVDDVFNYEIVKPSRKWRLPGPPKIVSNAANKVLKPFGKAVDLVDSFRTSPRIISKGPIKGGRVGNAAARSLLSIPGGRATAIGAGVGALGYGAYRGLRALDGR